jgi:hypothetical protein
MYNRVNKPKIRPNNLVGLTTDIMLVTETGGGARKGRDEGVLLTIEQSWGMHVSRLEVMYKE